VDCLDESWVDERLRVWLIRGLIETIRTLNKKVHHAKIIIALRVDLLARVYKATSDGGFQEDKYSGLNLNIAWTRDELRQLLDARVQALVRQRYTKEPVKLKDVLRGNVGKRKDSEAAIDYLLDRTLLRPRDAIQFLNACLEQAVDQPAITLQMLFQAEAKYSQQRRIALADEWSEHYPRLVLLTDLLKGKRPHFRLREITDDELDTMCLKVREFEEQEPRPHGRDVQMFNKYYQGGIVASELRALLAQCFYTVGLVGVRLASGLEVTWSSAGGSISLNSAEVNDEVTLHVHKAFWRILGIRDFASVEQQQYATALEA
jgi:hypothetical protein